MLKKCLMLVFGFLFASLVTGQAKIIAHSHNDYEQDEPLLKALRNGFASIEIDVFLYQGQIRVSHSSFGLRKKPTIQDLYFVKLLAYLNRGPVQHLWLLIDLKEQDKLLLESLHNLAVAHQEFFQSRTSEEQKPVKLILSGSIDRRSIADNPKYKFFFLDGRIEHLEENWDSTLMPLISANFNSEIGWGGDDPLPDEKRNQIDELVLKAHQQNKQLRFWRTPDKEKVWDTLIDLNLDVIGVDHIEQFARYLKEKNLKTKH